MVLDRESWFSCGSSCGAPSIHLSAALSWRGITPQDCPAIFLKIQVPAQHKVKHQSIHLESNCKSLNGAQLLSDDTGQTVYWKVNSNCKYIHVLCTWKDIANVVILWQVMSIMSIWMRIYVWGVLWSLIIYEKRSHCISQLKTYFLK